VTRPKPKKRQIYSKKTAALSDGAPILKKNKRRKGDEEGGLRGPPRLRKKSGIGKKKNIFLCKGGVTGAVGRGLRKGARTATGRKTGGMRQKRWKRITACKGGSLKHSHAKGASTGLEQGRQVGLRSQKERSKGGGTPSQGFAVRNNRLGTCSHKGTPLSLAMDGGKTKWGRPGGNSIIHGRYFDKGRSLLEEGQSIF